jgi:N-acetylglucosamine malate deacetylase 1
VNLKLLENKRILIIAAHPDDEILGCGGTIIKLKKSHKIQVVFLTNGISARTKNKKSLIKRKSECLKLFKYLKIEKPIFLNFADNQLDKIPLLKIVKKIEKIIKKFNPMTVFTHYENCLNIDHQIAYKATITACRPLEKMPVKKILSFEVSSSTDWAIFQKKNFQPNYFVDISNEVKKKLNSLKYYKSEMRKYPHSRSLKAVESLSRMRGASSGCKFAEAFILIRHIDK